MADAGAAEEGAAVEREQRPASSFWPDMIRDASPTPAFLYRNLLVCTVCLSDCGLVDDTGHPEAASSRAAGAGPLDSELAEMMSMSLPTSFSKPAKTKRQRKRKTRTARGAASDPAREQSARASNCGNGAEGPPPEAGGGSGDAGSPPPLQPGAAWQQAFDPAWQCMYYYNEATQTTQWAPPDCGFIPAPSVEEAPPDDGPASRASRPASTGLLPSLTGASGRHTVFSDSDETTVEQAGGAVTTSCNPMRDQVLNVEQRLINEDREGDGTAAGLAPFRELDTGSTQLGVAESGSVPAQLLKYWRQRYSLFWRFDEGVQLDEEGWYSVTPERVARHHAQRCACPVVLDAFSGVGGNAIAFAATCGHVMALELDPHRSGLIAANAAVYGVQHRVDVLQGDYFKVAAGVAPDVVFLSPPWGGPGYQAGGAFDVTSPMGGLGVNLLGLLGAAGVEAGAMGSSRSAAAFLPRNSDLDSIADTFEALPVARPVIVERCVLNGHCKALTVYCGPRFEGLAAQLQRLDGRPSDCLDP